MKWLSSNRQTWFLIILSLGIFLRFYGLTQPQLWLDEIIQIVRFSHVTLIENVYDLRQEIAAVPLDYMIQRLFLRMWGVSEFSARFHAALFGTLSLFCIYWLGATIQSVESSTVTGAHSRGIEESGTASSNTDQVIEQTQNTDDSEQPIRNLQTSGLFSMFLLAVYPLHLFYSQEGRNYSLFFFLTLSSFCLLMGALRSGGRVRWSFFFLSALCLLYTNYLGLVVLVTQGFFILVLALFPGWADSSAFVKKVAARQIIFFFLCASVAFLLFLPWLLWTYQSAQSDLSEDFLSLRFLLRFMKEVSGGSWPLSLLLFFLFGLGMRTLHRDRKRAVLLFILSWLILSISLVISLDWWRGYIFAIRQILFVTPAFLLGAAVGLQRLFEAAPAGRGRGLPIATLILTAILGVGTVSLSDRKQQADWKALNRYLQTELIGEDKVVVPNVERVVAFRYRQLGSRKIDLESLPPRGAFMEVNQQGGTELSSDQSSETPTPHRLHLIESRYATPEQLRKIRETLSLYPPERTVDIRGFRIYVLGI
jgi:uncharacterized membrane protein